MSNPLVLFGVPVYSYDKYVGSKPYNVNDLDTIGRTGFTQNEGKNFVSMNQSVLDLKNFKNIKDRILEGLREYTKNILCFADHIEFYLIQSWLNLSPPGTYHHRHIHPNSFLSGVYYIDVDEEASITFVSSNPDRRHGSVSFDIPLREYNIWNSLAWHYKVQTNQIIYFPSTLEHEVSINQSDKDRISLSFNIFFKGTIGDAHGMNIATIGNYI